MQILNDYSTRFVGPQTYYVANNGSDTTGDGSQAKPWATPRTVSNATVYLADGETFTFPLGKTLDFSGAINATVTSNPAKPATLLNAGQSQNITSWSDTSSGCTLANVTLSSQDGTGNGGIVRGSNHTFTSIEFGNVYDGLTYTGVIGLTISGGKQVGTVQGRCHYFNDVQNLNWSDGTFGPSQKQSPIRFSSPGARIGNISNVSATQVGSPFPIATWAIHAASVVTFKDCVAIGGEFSLDSAGDGAGDKVSTCFVENLTTVETKVNIGPVAYSCEFTGGNYQNSTGECVSVGCNASSGNLVTDAAGKSPKHFAHFYTACDLVVSDCTLDPMGAKNVPMIDGANVPSNDGGNNKVVASSVKGFK